MQEIVKLLGPEASRLSESAPALAAKRYPNGTLAAGSGAVATVVVWLSTNVFSLPMDAAAGAAFATVIISLLTLVGRKGIKGCVRAIWQGSGD